MLLLTRRVGEKIQLGDGVVVTVVRIADGSVRIGVEAPPQVLVLRGELHEAGREPTGEERSTARDAH